MFNESEIINLLLGVVALIILFSVLKEVRLPGFKYFKTGFIILFFSYVFTVVEGICFKGLFNFLEHFGYALSGLLFAFACWKLSGAVQTNSRPNLK